MAAEGPIVGNGGKITGVGDTGNPKAVPTPKVLAKPNTVKQS